MSACPRCRNTDVTAISIDLRQEGGMNFYACGACEERWWERDGSRIDLSQVIDLAGRTGRRKKSRPVAS